MNTVYLTLASFLVVCACTAAPSAKNGDAGKPLPDHPSDGGRDVDSNEEGLPHTPLEFDEVSKFGFSAQDAAGWLEGSHEAMFTFDDGTTTILVVTLHATRDPLKEFGIYAAPPASVVTISQYRSQRFPEEALLFNVQVQLRTADGQFNEEDSGQIAVYADRGATLRLLFQGKDIQGDYQSTIAALPPTYDFYGTTRQSELSSAG